MAEFETPAQGIVFFLLFGMQTVVIAVVLISVGAISVPGGVFILALTLGMYGLLVLIPWWQNRSDSEVSDDDSQPGSVERLKQRYAAGELSDEEFERKLDRLLDSEQHRAEVSEDADRLGASDRGEEELAERSSSTASNSSRSPE